MPPRIIPEDPSVFAVCSGKCSTKITGKTLDNYFGKAYTRTQWAANPVCDNCASPMSKLYEIKVPEVKPRLSR